MAAKPNPIDPASTAAEAAPVADGSGTLRVEQSFADAARASGGVVDGHYVIAGSAVRLRSANPEMLQRLSKAFSHLEAAPTAKPELTIHLWDSAAWNTPRPPTPQVGEEVAPGAFFYYSDPNVQIGYQLGTSGDARVLEVYPHAPTPALSVLANDRGEAWYWVADASRIPYWEQATPMVHLLDWWLRHRGLQMLHAGAVGTPEGGVLLVGKSGSGKSTSTLSTLQSDVLGYAGDDYLGVSVAPSPWVHSLYSSGKLMPNHVERLPFLLSALANTDRTRRGEGRRLRRRGVAAEDHGRISASSHPHSTGRSRPRRGAHLRGVGPRGPRCTRAQHGVPDAHATTGFPREHAALGPGGSLLRPRARLGHGVDPERDLGPAGATRE